jgi:hypothetical protein
MNDTKSLTDLGASDEECRGRFPASGKLSSFVKRAKANWQAIAEMPDEVVGAANTRLCSGEVDDGRRPKRCGLACKCEQ